MSPFAPKRPCASPGCRHLVSNAEPCPVHGKRPWEHARPSASDRGYGAAWRAIRKRILARDPVCTACNQARSTTVDHIKPKHQGGNDSDDNLRGLCDRCHRSKSGREGQASQSGRGTAGPARPPELRR